MAIYHFIKTETFRELLPKVLGAESQEQIVLKWVEEGQNIYEEGYDLEFCEVEVRRMSSTGIWSRTLITEDDFRSTVLNPLSERLQLREGRSLAAIQAKVGEVDEHGIPTGEELCVWYD